MDQIMLIGNGEQHIGTVKRYCHSCKAAVYVQIENVPMVENSQGDYSCVKCAITSGQFMTRLLHHGKIFDKPTSAELSDIIRDIIKRSRWL